MTNDLNFSDIARVKRHLTDNRESFRGMPAVVAASQLSLVIGKRLEADVAIQLAKGCGITLLDRPAGPRMSYSDLP